MNKEKAWTLTLCSRCKHNFELAGNKLVKHGWQEYAESCDFCQVGRGWEYEITNNDGRGSL